MPTTTSTPAPGSNPASDRRRRRRVLGWGLLALGAVGVGGAIEGITRAERDLERRVDERLSANGITGVEVEFSGQDGTLRCEQPLADPEQATRLADDLWGVRVADLDRSCTSGTGSSTGANTGAQDDALGDAGGDGSTSATTSGDLPATTDDVPASTDASIPTTDAPSATADATDATDASDASDASDATDGATPVVGDVTVELVDGRLVLTGPVADEAARAAVLEAAAGAVDPANIDDRLEVVGDGSANATSAAGASASDLEGLVSLVRVLPPNLVAGAVTLLGDGTLSVEGTYADTAGRDAVADAAEAAGVARADVSLDERAEATASDATRLTAELNDFVAANPILFEPNSATLTAEASAVVDQVAAIANRYAGVAILIEGHTDTDGNADRNVELSADRALTVRDALAARGVTAPMEIAGLGETQPILVGGVEDKAASRRVVFEVSAT